MSRNNRMNRDFISRISLSTIGVVLCVSACSGESSVPANGFAPRPRAGTTAPRNGGDERHKEVTQALFGLDLPTSGPFPADRFTVRDERKTPASV